MTAWLDSDQAAAHAACSPWTIRQAAQSGRLSGVKLSGPRSPWRFRVEDVDRWLEAGRLYPVRRRRAS